MYQKITHPIRRLMAIGIYLVIYLKAEKQCPKRFLVYILVYIVTIWVTEQNMLRRSGGRRRYHLTLKAFPTCTNPICGVKHKAPFEHAAYLLFVTKMQHYFYFYKLRNLI